MTIKGKKVKDRWLIPMTHITTINVLGLFFHGHATRVAHTGNYETDHARTISGTDNVPMMTPGLLF